METPCVRFARIDVADPERVAEFIEWLWYGDSGTDFGDDPNEWLWGLQSPRKRMARLLWQLVTGADMSIFQRRFTAIRECLVEDAQGCEKILSGMQKRLREVFEGYLNRLREDTDIGQGLWGEEWWLSAENAQYVRQQLSRVRPELLDQPSEYQEALEASIRALRQKIGVIPVDDFDPERVYVGKVEPEGCEHQARRVFTRTKDHSKPLPDPGETDEMPSTFAWGYFGHGPTALARAILTNALGGNILAADPFTGLFRDSVISTLPMNGGFEITHAQVKEWLDQHGLDREVVDAQWREVKMRQSKWGSSLAKLETRLSRIRASAQGRLRAQRFDLVADDFEASLYVDFMKMLEQGGYAVKCSECGLPISFTKSQSNRQRGRWQSGRPVYHPDCARQHRLRVKREYYRKRLEDPAFRGQERDRMKAYRAE